MTTFAVVIVLNIEQWDTSSKEIKERIQQNLSFGDMEGIVQEIDIDVDVLDEDEPDI